MDGDRTFSDEQKCIWHVANLNKVLFDKLPNNPPAPLEMVIDGAVAWLAASKDSQWFRGSSIARQTVSIIPPIISNNAKVNPNESNRHPH